MTTQTDIIAPHRQGMTVRVARWSAAHPWRAIAIWLVTVVACVALGQSTHLREVSALDTGVGQSGHAARMLHDSGLGDPVNENVLITARSGALDAGLASQAARAVTERMRALPDVRSIGTPVTSPDGTARMIQMTMAQDSDHAQDHVGALQRVTAGVQRDFSTLRVEEVGSATLNKAVNDQVSKDLSTAAGMSLPITLIILLIAFGAILAAGAPVLLAMSAVAMATGLSTLVSHLIPDSGTTSSMILLMGMAVGVDYSLFYVKRAREERARGRSTIDAIDIAAETSGHSVVVSGLAVIVAMTGLFLAGDAVFSSLAVGSIIVVAVAVLGSLTVLPALLAKLGGHIDRPRVPVLWRWTAVTREPRLWPKLLGPATRRPGRTLAVASLGLVAVALPALGLTLHSDSAAQLPRSIAATHTLSRLTAAFPGQTTSHQVVVTAPAGERAAVRAALLRVADGVRNDPSFVSGDAPAIRTSANGTTTALTLDAPFDAESAGAKKGVTELRTQLVPNALRSVPGARWAVGGDPASSVDYDHHLGSRLGWVIGFVVVMTMLMTGIVFRSVVLAAMTALTNLLSAAASFGILVLTFQHTWAESLLGFRSTGTVVTWIPLFTFAVLFGLSMDYHVFVVGRIREAAQRGMSLREAVRTGIVSSAGTVTSAALVMVSVFTIFARLHMVEMKELGFGLAVAVLIDAIVVRAIILPAVMILLGDRVWWPGGRRPRRVTQDGSLHAELTGAAR